MSEGNVLASVWSLAMARAPAISKVTTPSPRRAQALTRRDDDELTAGRNAIEHPLDRGGAVADAFCVVMRDLCDHVPFELHAAMPLPAFLGAPYYGESFEKNKVLREVLKAQPALARWCFTDASVMNSAMEVCSGIVDGMRWMGPLAHSNVATVRCSYDWESKLKELSDIMRTVMKQWPGFAPTTSSDHVQRCYAVALWCVLRTVNMMIDRLLAYGLPRAQADLVGEFLKNMLLEDLRVRDEPNGIRFVLSLPYLLPTLLGAMLWDMRHADELPRRYLDPPMQNHEPFELWVVRNLTCGVSSDGELPAGRVQKFRSPEETVPDIPEPERIRKKREMQEQLLRQLQAEEEEQRKKEEERKKEEFHRANQLPEPRQPDPWDPKDLELPPDQWAENHKEANGEGGGAGDEQKATEAPVATMMMRARSLGCWDPSQRTWLNNVLKRNSRYALPLAWKETEDARRHREVVRTAFEYAVRMAGGLSGDTARVHELPSHDESLRAGAVFGADEQSWADMADTDEGVESMPPPPSVPNAPAPEPQEGHAGAVQRVALTDEERAERKREKQRQRNRLRREKKKEQRAKQQEEEKSWQTVQKPPRRTQPPSRPQQRVNPARVPVRTPDGPARRPAYAPQPRKYEPRNTTTRGPVTHGPPPPRGGGGSESGAVGGGGDAPRRNAWDKPPVIPGWEIRRRQEQAAADRKKAAEQKKHQAAAGGAGKDGGEWTKVTKGPQGRKQQAPRPQQQRTRPQHSQQTRPGRRLPPPPPRQPNRYYPNAPPRESVWKKGPPKPHSPPKPGEPGYVHYAGDGQTVESVVAETEQGFKAKLQHGEPVDFWAQQRNVIEGQKLQVQNEAMRTKESKETGEPKRHVPMPDNRVMLGNGKKGWNKTEPEGGAGAGADAPQGVEPMPEKKKNHGPAKSDDGPAAKSSAAGGRKWTKLSPDFQFVPASLDPRYKKYQVDEAARHLDRTVHEWTNLKSAGVAQMPRTANIHYNVLKLCERVLADLRTWMDMVIDVMPISRFERRSSPFMTAMNPFFVYETESVKGKVQSIFLHAPDVAEEHRKRLRVMDVVVYLRDSIENIRKLLTELRTQSTVSLVFVTAILASMGVHPDLFAMWSRKIMKLDPLYTVFQIEHGDETVGQFDTLVLFTVRFLTRVAVQDTMQYLLFSGHVMMSEARIASELVQYRVLTGDMSILPVFQKWMQTAWSRSMDDKRKTFVVEYSATRMMFMLIGLDAKFFGFDMNNLCDVADEHDARMTFAMQHHTELRKDVLLEEQPCILGEEGVMFGSKKVQKLTTVLTSEFINQISDLVGNLFLQELTKQKQHRAPHMPHMPQMPQMPQPHHFWPSPYGPPPHVPSHMPSYHRGPPAPYHLPPPPPPPPAEPAAEAAAAAPEAEAEPAAAAAEAEAEPAAAAAEAEERKE